jgi:hypothetical protein
MKVLKETRNQLGDSLSHFQENANSMKILAIILSITGIIGVTWAFIAQNFMIMIITIILLKLSLRFFKKPDKNAKAYNKGISGER